MVLGVSDSNRKVRKTFSFLSVILYVLSASDVNKQSSFHFPGLLGKIRYVIRR